MHAESVNVLLMLYNKNSLYNPNRYHGKSSAKNVPGFTPDFPSSLIQADLIGENASKANQGCPLKKYKFTINLHKIRDLQSTNSQTRRILLKQ